MKMVRATDIDDREASVRSRVFQFQGIRRDGGRQTQSMADIDIDNNGSISPGPQNKLTRSHASAPLEDEIQSALESNQDILPPLPTEEAPSLSNAKGKSGFGAFVDTLELDVSFVHLYNFCQNVPLFSRAIFFEYCS